MQKHFSPEQIATAATHAFNLYYEYAQRKNGSNLAEFLRAVTGYDELDSLPKSAADKLWPPLEPLLPGFRAYSAELKAEERREEERRAVHQQRSRSHELKNALSLVKGSGYEVKRKPVAKTTKPVRQA